MGHIRAAVKLPVHDDPASDSRANCHIEQSRLPFSSAPACFAEGCGVRVVFQRHGYVECPRQIFDRVVPLPSREKVNVSKRATGWIPDTGGSDSDAGNLGTGILRCFSQHADYPLESV